MERLNLQGVAETVGRVADLLRQGETVIVFPEAYCHCGNHQGTFRPAFFQAAVDAGAVVQPIAIRYRQGDGRSLAPSFVPGVTFAMALHRITAARGLRVEAAILDPIDAVGAGRRALAEAAQAAVAAAVDNPSSATLKG